MLRFRAASVAGFSSHRGTFAAAVGAHHQHVQQRGITTRGQFNPIHTFDCHAHGGNVPTREEFSILITNPGPLRVGYSPDYLEWLYGCYQAKIHYAQEREKAENTFNGSLLSRGSGTKGDSQKHQHSHLAPPPGKQLRPPHSFRRRAGEAKRAHAQRTLDATSCQQGMLDLFERQPQFPVIHLDKAERFHVVELFKELVLERALEPMELWDKALLYRAILSERRASYPRSFDYIFQCIQHTQLAPTPEGGASSGSSQPTHPLLPSVEDYNYFVYLVKKYFVENAVEGHVVLRCHREPNAAALLFGTPAPKDDAEVFRIMFSQKEAAGGSGEGAENPAPSTSSSPRVRVPTNYPPIDALWRCPENEALLRILMFGELNLIVSENPFATKFPQALSFLTRPQAGGAPSSSSSSPSSSSSSPSPSQAQQRRGGRGGSGGGGGVPLSSLIAARRGHLMAPLPRHIEMALDGRANDLRRLQTRHQREDSVGVQRLLRPGSAEVEEHPAQFSAYADWAYFNPRAVRAEARDLHTRTAVEAMKMYAEAAEDRYRDGYETVEVQNMRRPMESLHVAPTYTPTQAHFLAILLKDKHLSFLRHVALGGHPEKSAELHKAATRLARALWRMAMDYHQEPLRRIHRQKVLVAAALLDGFVERVWAEVAGPSSAAEEARDERRRMALRLGSYTPMEKRVWDESGFPTDARAEDYQRWMAAPATA